MKRLPAKDRKKVSKAVYEFLKPTYFPCIPVDGIIKILGDHDLVLLQEDNTEWSGFLLGQNEHVTFTLGHKSSVSQMNGLDFYEPLVNVGLSFSWYKDDSRKSIEVTGYIS